MRNDAHEKHLVSSLAERYDPSNATACHGVPRCAFIVQDLFGGVRSPFEEEWVDGL